MSCPVGVLCPLGALANVRRIGTDSVAVDAERLLAEIQWSGTMDSWFFNRRWTQMDADSRRCRDQNLRESASICGLNRQCFFFIDEPSLALGRIHASGSDIVVFC